jgi:DOPA 4,5-dioxygenase
MIEIHFQEENKLKVLDWLSLNRQGLGVLIHRDTGDDYRDHAPENIIWLGDPLPLDFRFFDLVKTRTELSMH